jgi:hypothetical protein
MGKENERRPFQFTLEGVTRVASEVALRHGGHVPTVIAEGSRQPVIVELADVGNTSEDRARMMYVLGFELARSQAVGVLWQVFFISEGWLSVSQGSERPVVPPSNDPKRKEVLLISHVEIGQQQTQMTLLEMIRDDEGQLAELKALETIDDAVVKSGLLEALLRGYEVGMGGKIH